MESKKNVYDKEVKRMNLQKQIRKLWIITITVCFAVLMAGCQTSQNSEQFSSEEELYVVYEGVFLDHKQITDIFTQIRGQAPYSNVTQDFHVTTAFMPEKDERSLYGQEVEVKIVGYKGGAVTDDDGNVTHNEGLKVELYAKDEKMSAYISAHPANYHITGSYEKEAKYTGYLDFADMQPVEYTVMGRFGAFLNGGNIIYDASQLDK